MDYDTFSSILRNRGIASEPAWNDLKVLIAPLPAMKESPLGLYYPDGDPILGLPPHTIWVPQEADESTVLHELGHRYYHYYYDDLAEPLAEKYRKTYERAKAAMYLGARTRGISRISDLELALINEQMFSHGDVPRDSVLYSDVRLPVMRRI